jgi:hypothetical protein
MNLDTLRLVRESWSAENQPSEVRRLRARKIESVPSAEKEERQIRSSHWESERGRIWFSDPGIRGNARIL